jgi:hypothetical protein
MSQPLDSSREESPECSGDEADEKEVDLLLEALVLGLQPSVNLAKHGLNNIALNSLQASLPNLGRSADSEK